MPTKLPDLASAVLGGWSMRRFALAVAVVAGVTLTVFACADDATPEACTNVPPGGCPLSHGVACQDPACEAVYLCLPNNVWQLDQLCPPHEGGPPPAVEDAGEEEAAPRSSFDANVDAPPGAFGGPGCVDLEIPECTLGFALACGAGCCGCEDLFVCEGGGWTLWGACGDGGLIPSR
jgi:hypothetical protein